MEEEEVCRCPVPGMARAEDHLRCIGCSCPILIHDFTNPSIPDVAQHFSHKPLICPTHFRLIRLLPGHFQEPIVCEVLRFSIEDHPSYEAISYTWGDPSILDNIMTQRGIFKVTRNCKAVLAAMRDRYLERRLWIDAVCINQEDNSEKNHQVPLMTKIYAEADRVLIYLGDHAENSREFLQALKVGERVQNDGLAKAALDFLSRPWFSRAWVVQEVAVAKKAFVTVETDRIPWEYLEPYRLRIFGFDAINKQGWVPAVLLQKGKKPIMDLPSLFDAARSCSSSRIHDRFYAFLGLLERPGDLDLIPDYDMPVDELFVSIAAQAVVKPNHLDVLAEAGDNWGRDGRESLQNLPSDLKILIDRYPEYYSNELHLRSVSTSRTVEYTEISTREIKELMALVEYPTAYHRGKQEDFTNIVADCWKTIKGKILWYSRQFRTPGSLSSLIFSPEDLDLEENLLEIGYCALQFARRFHALELPSSCKVPDLVISLLQDAFYLDFLLVTLLQLPFDRKLNSEGGGLWLPSWAPDFSEHRKLWTLSHWRPKGHVKPVHAKPSSSYAEVCGRSLKVKVVILDRIRLDDEKPPLEATIAAESHQVAFSARQLLKSVAASPSYAQRWEDMQEFCNGRSETQTERSVAISPISARPWDAICILDGASVPFVLRPVDQETGKYFLIGECYLHGCNGPLAADDYWELIGKYRQYFPKATCAADLPWETIHLI
ncbi:heterokaryon incompatibility protein-domain-containing protein [Macrophomina phaseolina]|uniref:Heterokaryon incompatibility protein-domain-containing protein n=1 Tax=Macrophomina phaseolina TaxID=35725 RepID=A0ABQ8G132_9PEZI|nr:heterokaryon incompatibility protein-domain-containing protein [Macrophomina phaseolina]